MKTIREELIEVRNKLDELIMQLGTETEVTSPTKEPLDNIIFNPKVFDTEKKLNALKRTIGNFISINPIKDDKKIDARTKNQFFYLYAALWSLLDVLADESMVSFVRQMALWFPESIPSEKKKQRNYEQSLSHEKKKWEQENELLKVTEWKTFIKKSGMSVKKAKRFEVLAMTVYTTVNELLKGIRKGKH